MVDSEGHIYERDHLTWTPANTARILQYSCSCATWRATLLIVFVNEAASSCRNLSNCCLSLVFFPFWDLATPWFNNMGCVVVIGNHLSSEGNRSNFWNQVSFYILLYRFMVSDNVVKMAAIQTHFYFFRSPWWFLEKSDYTTDILLEQSVHVSTKFLVLPSPDWKQFWQ